MKNKANLSSQKEFYDVKFGIKKVDSAPASNLDNSEEISLIEENSESEKAIEAFQIFAKYLLNEVAVTLTKLGSEEYSCDSHRDKSR
jgi:hypothetical protein